ncbi:MAG: hypothetical protein NC123_15560 [Butyrivibrio sp.]|nr:hypothetical protein [Acetatifactor muris]MCM1560936.1 hypothetical protein [Butyrivibrio sp.]
MSIRGDELKEYAKQMYSDLKAEAHTYGELEKLIRRATHCEFDPTRQEIDLMKWLSVQLSDMLHEDWSRVGIAGKTDLNYVNEGKPEQAISHVLHSIADSLAKIRNSESVEITIHKEERTLMLPPEFVEKEREKTWEELFETARKFRNKFPDAKIKIDFTKK